MTAKAKTATVSNVIEQPAPFTPGLRKGEVCDYAFKMFRVKLERGLPLSYEDWVRAEK